MLLKLLPQYVEEPSLLSGLHLLQPGDVPVHTGDRSALHPPKAFAVWSALLEAMSLFLSA